MSMSVSVGRISRNVGLNSLYQLAQERSEDPYSDNNRNELEKKRSRKERTRRGTLIKLILDQRSNVQSCNLYSACFMTVICKSIEFLNLFIASFSKAKNLGLYHRSIKHIWAASAKKKSNNRKDRGIGVGLGKVKDGILTLSSQEIRRVQGAGVKKKRKGTKRLFKNL